MLLHRNRGGGGGRQGFVQPASLTKDIHATPKTKENIRSNARVVLSKW